MENKEKKNKVPGRGENVSWDGENFYPRTEKDPEYGVVFADDLFKTASDFGFSKKPEMFEKLARAYKLKKGIAKLDESEKKEKKPKKIRVLSKKEILDLVDMAEAMKAKDAKGMAKMVLTLADDEFDTKKIKILVDEAEVMRVTPEKSVQSKKINTEFVEVKDEKKEEHVKEKDETRVNKERGNKDNRSSYTDKFVNSEIEYINSLTNTRLQLKALQELSRNLLKNRADPKLVDLVGNLIDKKTMEGLQGLEVDFTLEEEAMIVKKCFDSIFIDGINNPTQIYNSFFGEVGFLQTELHRSKEISRATAVKIRELVDGLGLGGWVNVKNTVGAWNSLANTEEVTPNTFKYDLFLEDEVEDFFARDHKSSDGLRKIKLPEIGLDGKLELKEIEMESAVSDAMKRLRGFFEGSWKPDLDDPTKKGVYIKNKENWKGQEYWGYVGAELALKADLYKSLGINKYVGEAAFSMMLSHNMLTDTSSLDIFLYQVDNSAKRRKSYGVSEERDPFVREKYQEELALGHDKPKNEVVENWLAQNMPRHMIPTGLTGDGRTMLMGSEFIKGKGYSKSNKPGHWLKWRVEDDMYSSSQRVTDMAKGLPSRPATDPTARKEMMMNALKILTVIKEASKPDSDVDKIEDLKSKVLKWTKADLKDFGWSTQIGEGPTKRVIVNREFCLEDNSGNVVEMDAEDLSSRILKATSEMFLFTHSMADRENPKPWELHVLASKAAELVRYDPQSGNGTYIGLSNNLENNNNERNSYTRYVDKLWNSCVELVKSSTPPSWYQTGIPYSNDFKTFLYKQRGLTQAWPRLRPKLRS